MVVNVLSKFDFWNGKDARSPIDVICFLPNGICVTFPSLKADVPLNKIKARLWEEARSMSMSTILKPPKQYVFVVVSRNGGTEELIDEELSLFDVKPARPFLRLIQRQGDEQVKQLSSKISMLIGRPATTSKDEQVSDLRTKCLEFCNRISEQRSRASWERRAIYSFPPDFEEDAELPQSLQTKLEESQGNLKVTVYHSVSANHVRMNETYLFPHTCYPRDVIEEVLQKRLSKSKNKDKNERPDDFVLKELGSENYFLGYVENGTETYREKPLIQYKYIRDSLLWDKKICLKMVERSTLNVGQINRILNEVRPPLPNRTKESNKLCLWDITPSTLLRLKVQCALNIMADANMWKEVQVGIFHGGEEICESRTTSRQKGIHPVWNEYLEFQLPVAEIPRMARICLCIVGFKSKEWKRNKKLDAIPIAWANIPIFNYKGILNQSNHRVYCKQHTSKSIRSDHSLFNPLGAVSSTAGSEAKGLCIVIDFMKFAHTVVYPSDAYIMDCALRQRQMRQMQGGVDSGGEKTHYSGRSWAHWQQLIEDILKRDALFEMFEEDKELLWEWREKCQELYPESLPKLLKCVKWNNHEDVKEIHYLLKNWKLDKLEVEIALELLDYKFPDVEVRTLAVQVLDTLSDNQLEMYFLHLVQALKYESYLDTPLMKYLLQRALNNRRIGHYLFWHLKAEVGNPDYALSFGLILELYCRGAVEHIDTLTRQNEAINKMKTVTEILKACKDTDKLKTMRECFEKDAYKKVFTDLISPLDPRKRLKGLKVEKCKYMDSKKKPLWLVFENYDEEAEDVLIIFKNGDDLRQDMLTLLSLRLMENVWRSAGLDYGIIPYRVLSTGPLLGLIQVVPNSETLGRIQNQGGGVFKEEGLFKWLEEYCNKNDQNEKKPDIDCYIRNFTSSIIGYSVAMYVLGVGDRHNDNIMLKKDSGQCFHIDFGHFLGNVKKKFGYNREKAKFVLTNDLIYCINQSRDGSGNEPFNKFKKSCIEAFACLRNRGNLFITVFAMLISTGIPELNHPDDLDYLRQSLAMNKKSEEEAIDHFKQVFEEAFKAKFNTAMNFWFHNFRHYWIG